MKDKIITLGDIFKNLETEEKAFKFKNYITNLQEENKKLKEDNYELQKYINEEEGFIKDENRELGLRIDKAIEYIEERKNLNWYADGVFVYELLNILQGEDKDE